MKKLLFLALLAAGCAPAAGPPEVHYGEDECARCHMQVSEPRYAAARQVRGQVQLFDDPAELFEFRRGQNAAEERLWVHDYGSEAWLDARRAFYVQSSRLKTPMGFGVAAFAEATQAAQWGRPLTFEEAQAHVWLPGTTEEEKK